MKKKIKDLTLGECTAMCKKYRNVDNVVDQCTECPLGGYYCAVIFGMRFPEYLDDEWFAKRNKPTILEDEIDI